MELLLYINYIWSVIIHRIVRLGCKIPYDVVKKTFRINEPNKVIIRDVCENDSTPMQKQDVSTQQEYQELSQQLLTSITDLSFSLQNLSNDLNKTSCNQHQCMGSGTHNWSIVTTLEARICSLERQLDEKQKIIELLIGSNLGHRQQQILEESINNSKSNVVNSDNNESSQQQISAEKLIEIRSELITEAEHHHKETDKSQLSNASVANQKLNKKQHRNKNAVTDKQDSHQGKAKKAGERMRNDAGKQNKVKKIKVMIVGDSQLRRIDDSKLSNDHRDIEVNCKPGMKIKQAISKVGKSNKDIIIVHAATNDVKSSEPEQLCKDVIDTLNQIQNNNPNSRIAFSSVIRRKDDQSVNAKMRKLNGLLEEELAINGFDLIDNGNIQYSNLCKDGLHVNEGGIRKLSGNVSRYVKYC